MIKKRVQEGSCGVKSASGPRQNLPDRICLQQQQQQQQQPNVRAWDTVFSRHLLRLIYGKGAKLWDVRNIMIPIFSLFFSSFFLSRYLLNLVTPATAYNLRILPPIGLPFTSSIYGHLRVSLGGFRKGFPF